MYNEEMKERYLEQIDNTSTRKSTWIAISKIEECLDQDIAESTRDEIIKGLEDCDYISYSSLRTAMYLINDYINWYNKNVGTTDISIIKDITSSEVDLSGSLYRNLFFSPENVRSSVRFWPAKEGYFVPIISYLYFMGLTNNEIIGLKKSDVYEKDGNVYVATDKKTIKIAEEFIAKDFIEYGKVKNSTREHASTWTVYSIETGKYIRNFYTFDRKNKCPVTAVTLRAKYAECNKLLGNDYKNLSERVLICSGKLWRVKQEEDRTGDYKKALYEEFKQRGYDNERLYESYKKALTMGTLHIVK